MEWVDYGNPAYEPDHEFECPECGTPVAREWEHCSGNCFEASQL